MSMCCISQWIWMVIAAIAWGWKRKKRIWIQSTTMILTSSIGIITSTIKRWFFQKDAWDTGHWHLSDKQDNTENGLKRHISVLMCASKYYIHSGHNVDANMYLGTFNIVYYFFQFQLIVFCRLLSKIVGNIFGTQR